MNLYEHTYSVFKSSWGINIKIIAEVTSIANYDREDFEEIIPGLWAGYANKPLINGDKFLDEDKVYLWNGLKYVGNSILENSKYKNDTLIIIHALVFSLCDFQEEGLTPAIIEWAADIFKFNSPHIEVTFDKKINRYKFNYK